MSDKPNPLAGYFRKPELYVQIPTSGAFNPEIEKTVLDEIGILPMTAIDEISMTNPDALLNGEAIVELIKSCVPSIPEPRELCNVDAELLFLAIKLATYGKDVSHLHTCSHCKAQAEYNIDINQILDKFPEVKKLEPVEWGDLKIHIQPPKLESVTRLALIDVEQARILNSIQKTAESNTGENNAELEMAKQFAISFRKVSKQNVDLLINSIHKIETPEGDVYEYEHIVEFIDNVPTSVVKDVKNKIDSLDIKTTDLSVFEFVCEECNEADKVNFELNPVNFS